MNTDIELDLHQLLTPASNCVSLRVGPIDRAAMDILEKSDFEFAPVLDEQLGAVGLVATRKAKELAERNCLLSVDDADREGVRVSATCGLKSLLATLSSRIAVLVTPAPSASVETGGSEWVGLLTIYDLNRHYFRTLLYGFLAELEVRLAKAIEVRGSEPWEWIEILNEEEQARVVGYWKLAERRHADVGPTAACMLTQLIKIIAKDKSTLNGLRFRSKADFEVTTGGIPDFRNQIMHPVRPMILGLEDVGKLADRIDRIRDLNLRFAKLQTR
jgi:hypothetical protein